MTSICFTCRPCWSTGLGPTRWRTSQIMTMVATIEAEQGAGLAMNTSQSQVTHPSYSVRWEGALYTASWPGTPGERQRVCCSMRPCPPGWWTLWSRKGCPSLLRYLSRICHQCDLIFLLTGHVFRSASSHARLQNIQAGEAHRQRFSSNQKGLY